MKETNWIDKSTTIRIKESTKSMLKKLGEKDDSYNDIIKEIFHQRNILIINKFCGNEKLSADDFESTARQIFNVCKIPLPTYIKNGSLNGDGELIPFTETIYNNCIEMAIDEDYIGSQRELGEIPLAEAVTNAYCHIWDIPSPTWSTGGRRNPYNSRR